MSARSEAEIIISAQNQTRDVLKQIEQSLNMLENEVREVQESSRQMLQTFEKTQRSTQGLARSFTSASRGAGTLTTSVSSLGNVLGALGIAAVTQQLGRLSVESIQAAGSMQQLEHATTQVLGSAAEAQQRLEELVVVAI